MDIIALYESDVPSSNLGVATIYGLVVKCISFFASNEKMGVRIPPSLPILLRLRYIV